MANERKITYEQMFSLRNGENKITIKLRYPNSMDKDGAKMLAECGIIIAYSDGNFRTLPKTKSIKVQVKSKEIILTHCGDIVRMSHGRKDLRRRR